MVCVCLWGPVSRLLHQGSKGEEKAALISVFHRWTVCRLLKSWFF